MAGLFALGLVSSDDGHLRYDSILKVRDLIRMLEAGGWVLRSTKGSHRQFKHSGKPMIVTVPGHPGKDVPAGTLRAILKSAELKGGDPP